MNITINKLCEVCTVVAAVFLGAFIAGNATLIVGIYLLRHIIK